MSLNILQERGTPIEQQVFSWRDRVQPAHAKAPEDPFTRVRAILLAGVEASGQGFSRACAVAHPELRESLDRLKAIEARQQKLLVWLDPPEQTPLERSLDFERLAIDITASLALAEPDPRVAGAIRSGLVEEVDLLARYAAFMRRVEGRSADAVIQSHLDLLRDPSGALDPGGAVAPATCYDRRRAAAATKLNVLTLVAGEEQAHDYFMTIGPMFAERGARQLYADIASAERRHVARYASLADPDETWMERWLLHEAAEAYGYWSCAESETDPRIKRIWERFLDYELGHVQFVAELFERIERRDPAEVLPSPLSAPVRYGDQWEFIRDVLHEAYPLHEADGPAMAHAVAAGPSRRHAEHWPVDLLAAD